MKDIDSIASFFQHLDTLFQTDLKFLSNKIRILVNRLSKSLLFHIASEIIHPEAFAVDPPKEQIYLYVLDLIDTRFFGKVKAPERTEKRVPKNVCIIRFVNKVIDYLHLPSILKSKSVIELLPKSMQKLDNIPTVTFSLISPIRNKIFNYKEVVSSLNISKIDGKYCVDNLQECDCHLSDYCDMAHGHIVTGDLRFIENRKLRKLMSKGPNFREPRFLNFNKCIEAI